MSFRNWCLTIFDFNEKSNLQHESVKYSAYGEETCPTTNKKHLQCFVIFKEKVRFSGVKKLFPTSHIEEMRGNFLQNEKYCSKEGKLIEHGEKPLTQKEKGNLGKIYWEEQLALAKEDPSKCDAKLQITMFRNLEMIHEKAKRVKLNSLDVLDNWWFVGSTGTGKSRTARELYPDAYIKQCNKWWNDYDGQETVIIEDVNPDHKFMANFIDTWCDHYPFPAEYKGGQKTIRPKRFIITSRYEIKDILTDQSQIESWERRFKYRMF